MNWIHIESNERGAVIYAHRFPDFLTKAIRTCSNPKHPRYVPIGDTPCPRCRRVRVLTRKRVSEACVIEALGKER